METPQAGRRWWWTVGLLAGVARSSERRSIRISFGTHYGMDRPAMGEAAVRAVARFAQSDTDRAC